MGETLCDLSGGELRAAPLAAILVEALRLRVTGELRVDANGGTSRVYFRGGQPCGAQVFFGFKPLGQFLLEQGWIDIEALERSLAAVVDGRKQGEALVELGYLSRGKLHLGLALHHQRHLRNLAAVTEGTYTFQPLQELPAWTDDLRIPAHRAIVDALSLEAGQAVCRRILRRIPSGLGVRLRSGWERYTGHFQLDPAEQAFVAALGTPTSVEAVIAAGDVDEERGLALVAALFLMGILVPAPLGAEAPWATPGPALPSTPGPVRFDDASKQRSAGPAGAVVPGQERARQPSGPNVIAPNRAVLQQAAPAPAPGSPLEVDFGSGLGGPAADSRAEAPGERAREQVVEEPLELDLDDVEELAPDALSAGVRMEAVADSPPAAREPRASAFAAPDEELTVVSPEPELLARASAVENGLDPAERRELERQQRLAQEEARRIQAEREAEARRAREEALRQPAPGPRSNAAEAKERRSRLLQRAFDNILGVDGMRRPAVEGTPGPGSATPGPAGSRSWERLPTPGDPAFERLVMARVTTIADEDHFSRLGLPWGAGREEVKQAFFAAAKRLHPDKLPAAVQELAPQIKELFAAITESYQLLQDDERRKAYVAERDHAAASARAGGLSPEQEAQLQKLETDAAAAAKRRDYATVQRLLGEALAIEDRPDLRAHRLWARQSERPHESPQLRLDLERLAEEHPRCVAAHYYVGVLARVAGDTDRAEAAFHRALAIAPDHREARQELKVIEARRATRARKR